MPEVDPSAAPQTEVSAARRRLASKGRAEAPGNGSLRLFASALIDLAISLMEEAEDQKEEEAA